MRQTGTGHRRASPILGASEKRPGSRRTKLASPSPEQACHSVDSNALVAPELASTVVSDKTTGLKRAKAVPAKIKSQPKPRKSTKCAAKRTETVSAHFGASKINSKTVETTPKEDVLSSSPVEGRRACFSNILDALTYATPEQTTDASVSVPDVVLGKRRKIELIDMDNHSASALAVPRAPKAKPPKKKPRTITARVMEQYEAAESAVESELAPEDGAQIAKAVTFNARAKGPPKPRKPRATKPAKTAAKKKGTKAGKAAAPVQELLPPETAAQTAKRQHFVFGTSSQLREDSPTYLMDLQRALKESEVLPPVTEEEVQAPRLWSEAAIGTLIDADPKPILVDDPPPKSPQREVPRPVEVSTKRETRPLPDTDNWVEIDVIMPAPSPKQKRAASKAKVDGQSPGTPRPRGRPRKIHSPHSPPLLVKSPKERDWSLVDEVEDSEPDGAFTPSPPRSRSQQVAPLPDLVVTSPSKTRRAYMASTSHREWPRISAALFPQITATVKAAPPTGNHLEPSWREKMALYDPIVVEELTLWLNKQGLRYARKDGGEEELQPWMVQIWCEEKGICCFLQENISDRRSRS
ncbi:hypothetical protein EJ06DRAFT_553192 [Trichodelitschia bisporula]|uniref:Structure-specific endonuclease subunit SLX4 n=1 Tax=Trichodelitschia bisporula TaxID=703511 RepID=A0A6G1I7X3_9PEZI|nr:hypothetical protein EJ06DRAFT_553192 [Trichodelitschia bisporula]